MRPGRVFQARLWGPVGAAMTLISLPRTAVTKHQTLGVGLGGLKTTERLPLRPGGPKSKTKVAPGHLCVQGTLPHLLQLPVFGGQSLVSIPGLLAVGLQVLPLPSHSCVSPLSRMLDPIFP